MQKRIGFGLLCWLLLVLCFYFYFYAPLFKSATVIEGNEEDDYEEDDYEEDGSDAAGAGTIQSSTESQPQGVATKTNRKQRMTEKRDKNEKMQDSRETQIN